MDRKFCLMNILRFNVLLVESRTKNNPVHMVEVLKFWYNKDVLLSKKEHTKLKALSTGLHGSGYILNPQRFFDSTIDVLFKAQYIKLAGRRDYSEYKLLGISYLDLTYFSDLNIEAVKQNPLLKIENNKIYFKLEENTNGNLFQQN